MSCCYFVPFPSFEIQSLKPLQQWVLKPLQQWVQTWLFTVSSLSPIFLCFLSVIIRISALYPIDTVGSFPGVWSSRVVKLTSCIHFVSKLMRESVTPLPPIHIYDLYPYVSHIVLKISPLCVLHLQVFLLRKRQHNVILKLWRMFIDSETLDQVTEWVDTASVRLIGILEVFRLSCVRGLAVLAFLSHQASPGLIS